MAQCRQVLELVSGRVEYPVHFDYGLPDLEWQPSNASLRALEFIAEWRAESALLNLKAPIMLYVQAEWPVVACVALVAINLIHISPPRITSDLMLQTG